MTPSQRGLLRAALAIGLGLGLGLLIAWVIAPVQYVDTAPRTLRDDYRGALVQLIARAYAVDRNLDRARARLVAVAEGDPALTAAAAAQRLAAAGAAPEAVQAVAALASDLGARPSTPLAVAATPTLGFATAAGQPNLATVTAAPGGTTTPEPSATLPTPTPPDTATFTPAPTNTPPPTLTPRLLPTRTPTPTPLGAFLFAGQQQVCDPNLTEPLIQVVTQDRSGQEIGGAEVIVEWAGGFDHFFTGLKPELGAGYGDFAMDEGIEYTVHLAESPGALVGPLVAEICTGPTGAQFPGAWRLVFRQP
jgi:hypothetical protein